MDQKVRVTKISECITPANNVWQGKIERKWDLQFMNIYKVPLEYLVYNKLNWRIASRVRSLEAQNNRIDSWSEEWKKLIEKLLWDSKIDRNKRTMLDLDKFWQRKFGIITKDWIIIDWNRRAMLLNKINELNPSKNKKFETIVLDVTLEEAPLEIHRLETKFQMWEDEKLQYNPIEKYLKLDDLKNQNISIKEIAELMWEEESQIKKWDSTFEIMNWYLWYFNYNWLFTQLDWREDLFLRLDDRVNKFKKDSAFWFPWYDSIWDVWDLETIAFHFIRWRFEWKKFRKIAHWNRDNHFFWSENIWRDFVQKFRDTIWDESVNYDNQNPIDLDSWDLVSHLSDRDKRYQELILPMLESLMNEFENRLDDNRNHDEPLKQFDKAISAVSTLDLNDDELKSHSRSGEIKEKQKLLIKKVRSSIKYNNLDRISEIKDLVEKISNNMNDDERQELHSIYKKIWKLIWINN